MRKKLLSILLTLALLLSLIPAGYAADIEIVDEPVGADAPGGPLTVGERGYNYTWTLDDDGTLPISGTGEMEDYLSTREGFYNLRDKIKQIVIEQGMTSVGSYSFNECSLLSDISMPNGLHTIGAYAFENCISLTVVVFPDGLTEIKPSAFRGCSSLSEISLPRSLTKIHGAAFYGCTSLSCITIPENVSIIFTQAFYHCTNLSSITFCGDIPEIGSDAFEGVTATAYYPADNPTYTRDVRQNYGGTITWVPYTDGPETVVTGQCGDNLYWTLDAQGALTITGTGDMWSSPGGINWDGHKNDIITVVIEDGATSIGIEAFRKCTDLTSAVIPGSVVYIDAQAFDSCSSLSSVTLSEGLQAIGMYVFYNCSSLTSIRLPESVSNLALCSFASCTALREVQLSSRLTNIPIGCFSCCSSLTGVEIPDGVTSIKDGAFGGCASLTKVILPDGVTSIGSQAFADCSSVTKLVIPASVSEIGELAFNGCTGLKTAGLSGSGRDIEFGWTQTIPANAFSGCSNLAEAALPDSLTAIGSTAFANCALTEVTFPAGVTDIGSGAYDGCASLAVVRIPKNTVRIGSSAFRGCTGLTDVYYGGYEEEAAHNKSAGWSTVENDPLFSAVWHYAMKPEDGWALCGPELFYRYDAESGTLSIKGSGPMWDFKLIGTTPTHPWVDYNSDIVSVSFEPGVTHIGAYAFYVCKGLTSVTVPEGVTSVGDHAFHYCNTMTDAVLPESLKSIGAGAFSYCEKLLDCAIPAGVTEIGAGAFANCYVLQSLVIPEGIERIEKGSFGDCRSLTEVTIPDRVTVIGEGAFADCRSMEKLVFGRQVASIDRFAFTGCSSLTSVTFPASLEQIGEVAFASCSSLTAIRFEGSAPEFDYRDPFYAVTATAYYPANDPTWTEDVMQDYGGKITWVPYGEATVDYTVTLTDYTRGKATSSLDFGAKYSGELSFTVSADSAVLVAVKKGEEYTPVKCSTVGDAHQFTLNVTEDTELVFAFRGDANLDSRVNLRDAQTIKGHVAGDLDQPLKGIALQTADANSDGGSGKPRVNLRDAQLIKSVVSGDEAISW